MAFSETELQEIETLVGGFCRRRIPEEYKDKLTLEYRITGHDLVIYERRPYWCDPQKFTETPVAKIKFVRKSGEWRLYWMRGNGKWYAYDMQNPGISLQAMVAEIDADPFACFFG